MHIIIIRIIYVCSCPRWMWPHSVPSLPRPPPSSLSLLPLLLPPPPLLRPPPPPPPPLRALLHLSPGSTNTRAPTCSGEVRMCVFSVHACIYVCTLICSFVIRTMRQPTQRIARRLNVKFNTTTRARICPVRPVGTHTPPSLVSQVLV